MMILKSCYPLCCLQDKINLHATCTDKQYEHPCTDVKRRDNVLREGQRQSSLELARPGPPPCVKYL